MTLTFQIILKLISILMFLSTTFAFECGIRKINQPGSLIRNGQNSYPGQWPWLVSLHKKNQQKLSYFCGATLINSKTVVTAAHCITPNFNSKIIAVLGRFDLSNSSETNWVWREITQRKIHEDYKHDDEKHIKSEADIAIFIMEHSVKFSDFIQPICLPDKSENVYKSYGVVSGYGQPDPYKPAVNKPLHVGLNSVDLVDCLYMHRHSLSVVSKRSFCAGNNQSVPCFGDSGSGFVSKINNKWTLLGVTSHGFDSDCNANNLVIFVSVPNFVPWILRNQENNLDSRQSGECENSGCDRGFKCGDLLPLNSINQPNSSKFSGFYSGSYKDGSAVFPGTGNFPECPGVNPARITTSTGDRGQGAYLGCNRQHLFDKTQPKYFRSHPNLKWIPTNTNIADSVKGAIKVYWDENGFDFVARVKLNSGSKTYYQIGYYWNGDVCYWDDDFHCRTGNFEILACVD